MMQLVIGLAARLRDAHRRALGLAPLFLFASTLLLGLISCAHLARRGTQDSRLTGLALLGTTTLLFALWALWARRRFRDPRQTVVREVGRDDEKLAELIDRATGLAGRVANEATDPDTRELAELHLLRQLSKIKLDRIAERSGRVARGLGSVGLALSAAALIVLASDPFKVVEGLDIFAARDGRAPLGLLYLDDIDVVAATPAYMGRHEQALDHFDRTEQPRGTVLTLRGRPEHAGRNLVLTNGQSEVAFIEDGRGMLLARWTVVDSTEVFVAARFGDTIVPQRDSLVIDAIADLAPLVKLEGAPKTLRLVDTPVVSLVYDVADDHGLREIALVLRAGAKEERRTLSKPTDALRERGAHELATSEPFFKKSFVPVEVSIEAKDNDAVLGPKWGKSPAFIIVPPLVGEPEALRITGLLKARDAMVDLSAHRIENAPDDDKLAKEAKEADAKAQKTADQVLDDVLATPYGGLLVRGRTKRVVAGQQKRVRDASAKYEKAPTRENHQALTLATTEATLAVDSAIQALGLTDTRVVSKRLAEVADEVAAAARVSKNPGEVEAARGRLAAGLEVLDGGGKQLVMLGSLGADLGDIVRGGIARIGRERDVADYRAAELAAVDLADRLRLPLASMGGGGRPGVESGMGDGSGVDGGDASEADEEAAIGAKELEELIKRHQEELDAVEQALEDAASPEQKEALKKLAKEHAEALREAVKDLPDAGLRGSAAEKAAEGKKRASSMAGHLEQGAVGDAIEAGKDALNALREAARRGEKEGDEFFDNPEVGKAAKGAGQKLAESLDTLEKALDAARKGATDNARKHLEGAGKNEGRLAEKVERLRKSGEQGDASMPDDMLDKLQEAERAMKEAAKALGEGDADQGQKRQREAQRMLEMARGDDDPRERRDQPSEIDGDGKDMAKDAKVPGKDEHHGPEAFRKRVVDGLGKPGDSRLKDAIKRYAEGYLK